MSAYGPTQPQPQRPPLPSTLWLLTNSSQVTNKPSSPFTHLTLHHLTKSAVEKIDGLLEFTHETFAAEVEAGMTYPQEIAYGEKYTREAFEAYIWGADVVIAIGAVGDISGKLNGTVVEGGVLEAKQGRSWEECLVGFYYVKPNYPGRSSHVRFRKPFTGYLIHRTTFRSVTVVL
jgi:hypothetical protein